LRILHVAHGWPPAAIGGTEIYAAALADAQRRAGHVVEHWCGGESLRPARGFRETFDRPDVDAAFAAACASLRPAVVHVHHLTGLSMGIPRVARAAGARVVVTLHDAWLACARGQLVDVAGARCPGPSEDRCVQCLAPALWAPLPPSATLRLPRRRGPVRARQAALAALVANVDVFLSPSRHLPDRIGVPAQWLPLPLVSPVLPAPVAPAGPVRFLFLGGLLPTKGARIALDAFAGLPAGAATLRIVGPPLPYAGRTTYVDALRARVAEVPGATLEPPVPRDAVGALFADADVFVFPSTWDENSPLVLREAAAAGLRVVASDVPGVAEVLGDRGAGARVEPGSVDALRRAMAAEVRRGRARVPPVTGEDLDTHAARVVAVYRTAGTLADPRDVRRAPL
jgi:glycosyltransferase involved in cell wall biosynthesis